MFLIYYQLLTNNKIKSETKSSKNDFYVILDADVGENNRKLPRGQTPRVYLNLILFSFGLRVYLD